MKKQGKSFFKSWHSVVAIILLPIVIGLAVIAYTSTQHVPVFNPQGSVGAHEKDLILFTLALSTVVVVPVLLMLGVFAWRYRDTNHKAAYTPDADGNRWLELLWWGIPIAIIAILSVVTWVSTHALDPNKPLESNVKPLKVQVVALQWRWLFIYPEQHVATVNELVIPAGTPVNFSITADGPMSALWIPSLGTQVYAMTGMASKLSLIADNPGTFRGSNSNISGTGYADMNFDVKALNSRQDFDAWVDVITNGPKHEHLDLDEYLILAKPTHDTSVDYLHLHDANLFDEIVTKYAHSDSGHHSSKQEGHEE